MKTLQTKQFKTTTTLVAAIACIGFGINDLEAGKGGGGNGKGGGGGGDGDVGGDTSGWVFTETFLDVMHPNGIPNGAQADDPDRSYVHEVDSVESFIGRNFSIDIFLNNHKKKASIRTLHLTDPFAFSRSNLQALPTDTTSPWWAP